jgi:hypothetical protein
VTTRTGTAADHLAHNAKLFAITIKVKLYPISGGYWYESVARLAARTVSDAVDAAGTAEPMQREQKCWKESKRIAPLFLRFGSVRKPA